MFECLMCMFVCPTSFAGSQRLHRTAVGLCAKDCVLSSSISQVLALAKNHSRIMCKELVSS